MKKIYLLALTLVSAFSSFAQTVYSENMGSPSATTLITAYSGWQNTSPITYSGTGDVRTSTASSGYTGASGSGNVFLAAVGGRTFIIGGLNTSAYNTADLQLSFGWLTTNAAAVITVETSTDGTNWNPLTIPANPTTAWTLKTITSGIPSSTTLSLRFTAPATSSGMRVDDVKIANVSASCALVLGTPTTLCDATTLGTDTYTITIPYTGGGTATYIITPTVGTVGGDNPSSVAAGNITISGINEGIDSTISIVGGTCNFSLPVLAPANGCKPVNTLPFTDSFPYTIGNSLGNEQKWINVNTGDNILIASGNLTYPGVTPSGNSVTFDGAGIEARAPFTSTTSGTIYSSFLFSIPAAGYDNVTTDLTSTYFALFTDNAGGSTNARVWIRKNGTQYQFGLSPTSLAADVVWSSILYNVATTQYLVFGYDFGANSLALYENQATPTTPDVSVTPGAAFANLGGFMLRQDAANTTPTVIFDELKINTTLPTLARNENNIAGLRIYPNPAKTNLFITSDSFATKKVEVYNILGAKILTAQVNNSQVNVSGLKTGVYTIKITEEGKTATTKLVIE